MTSAGTTTQRGYGWDHQKERARWKPIVDAGRGVCMETICLHPTRAITPGTPWHLAHTDDRSGYKGPAHKLCNESDGGARSRGPNPLRLVTARPRRSDAWV